MRNKEIVKIYYMYKKSYMICNYKLNYFKKKKNYLILFYL